MNQNIIDLIDKLKLNYSGYNYENFEFNNQSILIIDTIMKNKIIEIDYLLDGFISYSNNTKNLEKLTLFLKYLKYYYPYSYNIDKVMKNINWDEINANQILKFYKNIDYGLQILINKIEIEKNDYSAVHLLEIVNFSLLSKDKLDIIENVILTNKSYCNMISYIKILMKNNDKIEDAYQRIENTRLTIINLNSPLAIYEYVLNFETTSFEMEKIILEKADVVITLRYIRLVNKPYNPQAFINKLKKEKARDKYGDVKLEIEMAITHLNAINKICVDSFIESIKQSTLENDKELIRKYQKYFKKK